MKRCYKEREIKTIMQKELVLPVVVTEKIADTLQQTHKEYDEAACKSNVVAYKKRIKLQRRIAAVFALCLLGVGTTVGAVELKKWNEYAAQDFHADVESQDKMLTDGQATNPPISVTDNGVTVSVEQVVADNYGEYLLLKVEAPEEVELPVAFGFATEFAFGENSELCFEEPAVGRCSGQALTIWNEDTLQSEKVNDEKNVGYYAYEIYSTQADVLQEKDITIRFTDLVEYLPKAQSQVLLEGEWEIILPKEIQESAKKGTVQYKLVTEKEKTMKSVSGWKQVTVTPLRLTIGFGYENTIPYSEENDSLCELTMVLPYLKEIRLKSGDVLKVPQEANDYVEVNHDEKTQREYEKYVKARDYEKANAAFKVCNDWAVKLCVYFPAVAKIQEEDNCIWQNGIVNPEEIAELVFEHQGEEITYKVE